jgi:hypothetical protein
VGPKSDSESINHLEVFFALYDFEYDSSKPATDEFRRMSRSWGREAREEAREGFKDALVQEFNKMYGTDVNDIGSWQGLCRVLGIAPVPDKLKECREVCPRNWDINLKRSLILDVRHDTRQWKKHMSTSSTLSIGQTISRFSQPKWPSVFIRRRKERYSRSKTRTRADC